LRAAGICGTGRYAGFGPGVKAQRGKRPLGSGAGPAGTARRGGRAYDGTERRLARLVRVPGC